MILTEQNLMFYKMIIRVTLTYQESLLIQCDSLREYNGEKAVEPRIDSSVNGNWPEPEITKVIEGGIRIPNNQQEPIPLTHSQHIAQIKHVLIPDEKNITLTSLLSTMPRTKTVPFSNSFNLYPDNLMNILKMM